MCIIIDENRALSLMEFSDHFRSLVGGRGHALQLAGKGQIRGTTLTVFAPCANTRECDSLAGPVGLSKEEFLAYQLEQRFMNDLVLDLIKYIPQYCQPPGRLQSFS